MVAAARRCSPILLLHPPRIWIAAAVKLLAPTLRLPPALLARILLLRRSFLALAPAAAAAALMHRPPRVSFTRIRCICIRWSSSNSSSSTCTISSSILTRRRPVAINSAAIEAVAAVIVARDRSIHRDPRRHIRIAPRIDSCLRLSLPCLSPFAALFSLSGLFSPPLFYLRATLCLCFSLLFMQSRHDRPLHSPSTAVAPRLGRVSDPRQSPPRLLLLPRLLLRSFVAPCDSRRRHHHLHPHLLHQHDEATSFNRSSWREARRGLQA